MTLLRAVDLSLSFGPRILFHNLEFVIEAGERVGLVGVNGSGKSTLMKILAGTQKPDTGTLQIQRGARTTFLPQEPTFEEGATIASELEVAQAPLKNALAEHEKLSKMLEDGNTDEHVLNRMSTLSEQIERLGGWNTGHEAKKLLDRLGVKDWQRPIKELSGGMRKRVAVARALLSKPDLLMLDEPTNHLDADTVEWLEDELDIFEGALLLVTHDRYFLDGLVERMVEIEPPQGDYMGRLISYPGNYEQYLEQKIVALGDAESQSHKRDRWIAQEVSWMRKGLGGRRVKSKSRMERARKLLTEQGFKRPAVADIQLAKAPRLSQIVVEAKKIGKSFGPMRVFRDVSVIVQPGERIGIIGVNGAGKTTLIRTLLGELPPDSGTVTIGQRTKVAYYDQQRTQLDDELTVYEAAWHDDHVNLGGSQVRLSDYLEDLLFPIPMQRMKVKGLSGGERNRLLLARLFLEGANVLVLDEPTNDLDLVTLNVLERLMLQFTGSILLVTHDRYFLNKVATSILAFEGNGYVTRYEGNWDMYKKLRPKPGTAIPDRKEEPEEGAKISFAKKTGRLGYKDQRELDGMEAAIEKAENDKAHLEEMLTAPENVSNAGKLRELSSEIAGAQEKVEKLYARWEELQQLAGM